MTVVELSSFQLELIKDFRTDISVFLNLTPDHLDRHHTMELYSKAKARIFENQREEDFAILNADDPGTTPLAPTRPHLYWFSRKQRVAQGAFVRGSEIVFRNDGMEEVVLKQEEVPLPGAHNLENVLAAVAATRLAGASSKAVREGVLSFAGVEHRLEFVAEVNGVPAARIKGATTPFCKRRCAKGRFWHCSLARPLTKSRARFPAAWPSSVQALSIAP